MRLDHCHPSWTPQENITITFDDKTAEARSTEQIDAFFKDVQEAANRHDFDISCYGNDHAMYVWLAKLEQTRIESIEIIKASE